MDFKKGNLKSKFARTNPWLGGGGGGGRSGVYVENQEPFKFTEREGGLSNFLIPKLKIPLGVS